MRSAKRLNTTYSVYGLACASPFRLPCPRAALGARVDVEFLPATARTFARVRAADGRVPDDWFQSRRLDDGSTYLCWTDNFEFLVSANGRRIWYRGLGRATPESFRNYLLAQVLSFSLLAAGTEPLHGTAATIGDGAAVLLGACGSGKSTLGAALLRAGSSLVTDDLVSLELRGRKYRIHPGVPRIKLFPAVARSVFGSSRGTAMIDGTTKLILPLAASRATREPVPLCAAYVLSPSRRVRGVVIRKLAPRAAMLAIVRHSFNTMVVDPGRLARQFGFARDLTRRVPVLRLSYPRRLAMLPTVCEALVRDVRRRSV